VFLFAISLFFILKMAVAMFRHRHKNETIKLKLD